jgi:hypothetical protein
LNTNALFRLRPERAARMNTLWERAVNITGIVGAAGGAAKTLT